jgi:hypothetical protein
VALDGRSSCTAFLRRQENVGLIWEHNGRKTKTRRTMPDDSSLLFRAVVPHVDVNVAIHDARAPLDLGHDIATLSRGRT